MSTRIGAFNALVRLSEQAEPRLHTLVDDPADADLILFVGGDVDDFSTVLRSPLPKRYPRKSFIYFDADGYVPLLPGIYSNARSPRLIDLRRTDSGTMFEITNPYTEPMDVPKRFFFSFAGGSTSIVRKRLFRIDWHREDVLVRNTSGYQHWGPAQDDREERQRRYAEDMAASRFVLCPRGASAGSQRLFESMQIGAVPVLISDRFKLPHGPDWDRFLVRVRERDIARLPEILERYESESAERGALAREAYLRWFAAPQTFNTIVGSCARMQREARVPETWVQPFWGVMRARHLLARRGRSAARGLVLRALRILRVRFAYDLNG